MGYGSIWRFEVDPRLHSIHHHFKLRCRFELAESGILLAFSPLLDHAVQTIRGSRIQSGILRVEHTVSYNSVQFSFIRSDDTIVFNSGGAPPACMKNVYGLCLRPQATFTYGQTWTPGGLLRNAQICAEE